MKTTVLVVDDSAADRLRASSLIAEHLGWDVVQAEQVQDALDHIARSVPHVILTALAMAGMDGLELVLAVRRSHPLIPIVLMTAPGSEGLALKALRNGASSYVPKERLDVELIDVLEQVHAVDAAQNRQQRLSESLTEVTFHYRLDNDPHLVPAVVSQCQYYLERLRLIDEAGKNRVGIALEEALLNALYHGNLEVSSELRQNGDDLFHALAEQRRRQDPYQRRRIDVLARFSLTEAEFVITDEGPGFDPASLPDPTDPENLLKSSGRGIMLIRTFMDEVNYNQSGNQVRLIKRRTPTTH